MVKQWHNFSSKVRLHAIARSFAFKSAEHSVLNSYSISLPSGLPTVKNIMTELINDIWIYIIQGVVYTTMYCCKLTRQMKYSYFNKACPSKAQNSRPQNAKL